MLLPLSEARAIIDQAKFRVPRVRRLPTVRAAGKIAARTIRARIDQPSADRSAMDGFAVHLRRGREDLSFVVDGVGRLGTGRASPIATGAVLPAGATAVARQEITRREGNRLLLRHRLAPGTDIHLRAEDLHRGSVLVRAGTEIRPLDLGAFVAQGIRTVPVFDLRVGILPIGDEILPATSLRRSGVRDAISPMLAALTPFARVRTLPPARDDSRQIARRLEDAVETSDLVVTVGGSSVGPRDFTKSVIAELGEVLFEGVRTNVLKRGGLGRIRRRPVLILPGQAVSALTVFHEHGLHVLSRLVGRELRRFERLPLGEPVPVRHRMDSTYLFRIENGRLFPLRWGVGLYSELTRADGFGILTRGRSYASGDFVEVERLRPG